MRLWDTASTSDSHHEFVDHFTVGDDYQWDNQLLEADVRASKAHALMLLNVGVITDKENKMLQKSLDEILLLHKKGEFLITRNHEDCHTAIEEYLTMKCGDTGKKIHTGRSRNDQVLVAMRIIMKEKMDDFHDQIQELSNSFSQQSKKWSSQIMPGYTHMQKAMPTTVGIWLQAFADGLSDQIPPLKSVRTLIDQNPLGSASGFGIRNFKNNRPLTTRELHFQKTQENPIYCGLSRGLFEYQCIEALTPSILILSRFIADILFFTADGKKYFTLPDFLTTGSSIMPQKKNVDPAEIFRGKVSQFLAIKHEIEIIYNGLPSGYNRDISLIKQSYFRASTLAEELMQMAQIFAENVTPNAEALQESMTEDLFVTEKIYNLVKIGVPFREAYQQVKEEFMTGDL